MKTLSMIALIGLALGCAAEDAVEGGASPEDVFARLHSSFQNEKWSSLFGCMDPESRDGLLFMMTQFGGLAFAENEKAMNEFNEVLKSHKVGETDGPLQLEEEKMKEAAKSVLKDVPDKAALYGELIRLMTTHADRKHLTIPKEAGLGDLKIEGDKASARYESEGGRKNVTFVRKNDRWYVKDL